MIAFSPSSFSVARAPLRPLTTSSRACVLLFGIGHLLQAAPRWLVTLPILYTIVLLRSLALPLVCCFCSLNDRGPVSPTLSCSLLSLPVSGSVFKFRDIYMVPPQFIPSTPRQAKATHFRPRCPICSPFADRCAPLHSCFLIPSSSRHCSLHNIPCALLFPVYI